MTLGRGASWPVMIPQATPTARAEQGSSGATLALSGKPVSRTASCRRRPPRGPGGSTQDLYGIFENHSNLDLFNKSKPGNAFPSGSTEDGWSGNL